MANNEFVGSAIYAQWIYSGGTIQINTDFRNWSYVDQGQWIDTTAGADTSMQEIPSYDTGQVTASFLLQSNMGTTTFTAFARGTQGTLIWGEAGTASGAPKTTLPAKVYQGTRTVPYNDVVSMDVQWNQNGTKTLGTY